MALEPGNPTRKPRPGAPFLSRRECQVSEQTERAGPIFLQTPYFIRGVQALCGSMIKVECRPGGRRPFVESLKMFISQLCKCWLIATVLLAAWASPVAAQDKGPTRLDRAEVEAWADQYYGQAVAEKRNAAIGISVVQDGKLLFQKTYGYRDYGKKIVADPNTTGFMVGSITKTFVATAIAQLVDRGVIRSLDDPVNKYLTRVKLPGSLGAKVTIADLLNHRAGFEDVGFGFLSGGNGKYVLPLPRQEIMRFLPDIVRNPGGTANYNNWGFSLLGFMVEDIVHERLDTYLKRSIFDPLGMKHTMMWYDRAPGYEAMQYRFTKGGKPVLVKSIPPHPWIAPAGTIVSTPSDMALYMNAQILEGRDGGFPLLSEGMFSTMHRETYRNAPISIGFAHAFWTDTIDGAATIEHGGGTPGFQSMMTMIPDRKIGFFVSAVQSGLAAGEEYDAGVLPAKRAVQSPLTGFELRQSFVERFFPARAPFPHGPKTSLANLAGTYLSQARAYNTVEKLGTAFDPSKQLNISLAPGGDGVLMNGFGPYRDIGNGVFENASGVSKWDTPHSINPFHPDHIAFKMTADGKPSYFVAGMGDQVWSPVSPLINPHMMLLSFLILGSVLLSGALIFLWPVENRGTNAMSWIAVVLAISVAGMVYSVIGGFDRGDSLSDQLASGDASRLWALAIASNLILLLGTVMAVLALRQMRARNEQSASWAVRAYRLHTYLLVAAVILLIPAFLTFNLIGFHIPGRP